MNELRNKLLWHIEIGFYVVLGLIIVAIISAFLAKTNLIPLILVGLYNGMLIILLWFRLQLGFEE